MRAVIQRVIKSRVVIDEATKAAIGHGLVILLGIEKGDNREKADYLAKKITNMRIFGDHEGELPEVA